jgi:hypothetical protein
MSFGEQAYLVLVLTGFVILTLTLATVAWQTNRWSPEKNAAADDVRHQQSSNKAA